MTLITSDSILREHIQKVLPRVEKPARYLGGELNSVRKPSEEVSVRFALAFPDTYEIGMSNLGLRILYDILNLQPGIGAERVFAPALDMEAEMRRAGIPLFSLESSRSLGNFDIIGFSLAYEMTYTTVLHMLDLAGIPLFARDRTPSDPIIIAGGHCATNPEPMAEFIDAFVIGDGEEAVVDIAHAALAHQGDRNAILNALAAIEGVYVPQLYDSSTPELIRSRIVSNLEDAQYPTKPIVPFVEAVHDRAMVEIMRGCSRGCRFCQAGMITRPVRERSLGKLCEQASMLLENTGHEEIGLMSLSSADYSEIGELVSAMITQHGVEGVGVSLPSLRADAQCVHLAAEIQKVRKSGLTFAPEAGSQRLRDVINKNVTEQDLLDAVDAAVIAGWKRLKLYFMIGLPTETDEDLMEIGRLVSQVMGVAREQRSQLTLNVTISPFAPKPHTPFQWRAMDSPEELDRKISMLRPLLDRKNVQLSWHDPKCSQVEAALARGDRKLSQVIYQVWANGAKFEQDRFDPALWQEAFAAAGLDIASYANTEIAVDSPLPWDHIDAGVSKEFLAKENCRAETAELTPDCRFGECSGCGIRQRTADGQCPPLIERTSSPDQPAEKQILRYAQNDECEKQILRCTQNDKRKQTETQSVRVLMTFSKIDEVRWLGHLDLMRLFERAIRMSRVDVAFTLGFNPRIKMSIASALPLGATGDRELLSLHINGPIDLKEIVSKINAKLPEGLALVEARVLKDNEKTPLPTASEYMVDVAVPEMQSLSTLKEAIDALMALSEIEVVRDSAKKSRAIDIRAGIQLLELAGQASPHSATLKMALPHRQFTVKPSEVVRVLGDSVPGIAITSIHRSQLIIDI